MKISKKYLKIEFMQYNKLGTYIKEKCLSMKKTLNSFAIENEIEPAILCRIENLKQDIKLDVLRKIANGFGKTAGEFLIEFEQQN